MPGGLEQRVEVLEQKVAALEKQVGKKTDKLSTVEWDAYWRKKKEEKKEEKKNV